MPEVRNTYEVTHDEKKNMWRYDIKNATGETTLSRWTFSEKEAREAAEKLIAPRRKDKDDVGEG